MVYNFNKNLSRMHRSDRTNTHMQYHVYNYHMLLLLLLGRDFYCSISSHVDCCTSQGEDILILEVKEELDILSLDIKVVEEIAREAMVKIEESSINIQIVKVVKRAVFNKFEATIENMIELELRLANLNK